MILILRPGIYYSAPIILLFPNLPINPRVGCPSPRTLSPFLPPSRRRYGGQVVMGRGRHACRCSSGVQCAFNLGVATHHKPDHSGCWEASRLEVGDTVPLKREKPALRARAGEASFYFGGQLQFANPFAGGGFVDLEPAAG